jgi:hypothetical protein
LNIKPEQYAFAGITAIQEANDFMVRVYNLQIKNGHKSFYNQFGNGPSIFSEIKSYTYFDIFEDRPGTLTCRPVRLNNLFINSADYEDYFMIRGKDVLGINYKRNDTGLTSRVDYHPTFPLRSDHIPFCLNYTNSQIMLKYGLNIREGPSVNPNVLMWQYTSHFAAVALAYRNGISRTMSIDVAGNRKYCLGRVYFIPNFIADGVGFVGRLANISTAYRVGAVPIHTLQFNFVRIGKTSIQSEMDVSPAEILTVSKFSSEVLGGGEFSLLQNFIITATQDTVNWEVSISALAPGSNEFLSNILINPPFWAIQPRGRTNAGEKSTVGIYVSKLGAPDLTAGIYTLYITFTNTDTKQTLVRSLFFDYII